MFKLKSPLDFFVDSGIIATFAAMNLTSSFIFALISDVSDSFTELSEVSHSGFNILLRAKRNGQWWMLKTLQPAFLHDTTYQMILQKVYDIPSRLVHPGVVKVKGLEEVEGYDRCIET